MLCAVMVVFWEVFLLPWNLDVILFSCICVFQTLVMYDLYFPFPPQRLSYLNIHTQMGRGVWSLTSQGKAANLPWTTKHELKGNGGLTSQSCQYFLGGICKLTKPTKAENSHSILKSSCPWGKSHSSLTVRNTSVLSSEIQENSNSFLNLLKHILGQSRPMAARKSWRGWTGRWLDREPGGLR